MPLVNLTSAHKYVIGIDFGHGETSAAIARLDTPFEVKDVDSYSAKVVLLDLGVTER